MFKDISKTLYKLLLFMLFEFKFIIIITYSVVLYFFYNTSLKIIYTSQIV